MVGFNVVLVTCSFNVLLSIVDVCVCSLEGVCWNAVLLPSRFVLASDKHSHSSDKRKCFVLYMTCRNILY